ncbi:hypothetical protein POTOM_048874 [Populus tomentosa]|uniref:Uncharacterized protein n=1 Tax=Populus tomentosa TaxID=118781 RepID=A0A8X7Y9W3_POPTO|nr:hypothetical protein POTOM_048874 [Populus tomentosa]
MANKKKKSGSHRSQFKQQASHFINDRSVLALEAPSMSHTVHITVPPNSNSPHNAPVVLPTQSYRPVHHLFSTDRPDSPNHGEPSPSINHIFMDDYSDDEELEAEADLDSCGEDYVNGSKFFTSSPLVASTNTPPVGSQFIPIVCPTSVIPPPAASLVRDASPTADFPLCATSPPTTSPLCAVSAPVTSPVYAMPAHAASPGCATSVPVAPIRGTAPSTNPVREIPNSSEPSSNPWRGTSVAGCSEANQSANCGPNPVPVVDEIVSENGTVTPNSGGWELVQRKKARRKSSPSRNSSGSTPVAPRVAQGNSHIIHRARLPSPPPSVAWNISSPVPTDVAGHRADKGKSVVISSAPGHLSSKPLDIPTRRKTQ